jgi:hypothetical protein
METAARAPWYARLVGWVLVTWGLLQIAAFVLSLLAYPPFVFEIPWAVLFLAVLAGLPLAGGVGTVRSRRWGWVVGLLAVAMWLTIGLIAFAQEAVSSLPFPGAEDRGTDPTALVFVVVPSPAMLGGLLAPATIRWLRAPARPA